MDLFNSNINPVYVFRRKGDANDPYVKINETLKVDNQGCVVLKEIPDRHNKVTIRDENNNLLYEVHDVEEVEGNKYYVDYIVGNVYFSDSQIGKRLKFTYYGTGVILIGAERIYIEDDGEKPTKTLKELVDESRANLEADSQSIDNKLQEADAKIAETEATRQQALTAIGNANTQANYAKSQGDYAKSVADQNKTRWLTPVNTFSDISTTYPSPQHGDTVMTTGDGKIYRYVSGSGWKLTQQYNNTVLNDVVNKLTEVERQTQTLEHGLSVLNGNVGAPVDIQIEGRTLVNVSQNVLDPAKYYVVADKKSKVKFSDGTTYAGVAKFAGRAEKPILIRVSNFENKVSGSTLENPHVAKRPIGGNVSAPTTLLSPSSGSFTNELFYSSISRQDNNADFMFMIGSNVIAQHLFSFNLIEAIERNVGKIPAYDTAGKVAWLKNNIAKFTFRWWGYGQSPTGYKATVMFYRTDLAQWSNWGSHTNGTVTQVTNYYNVGANCIDTNGFVHFLAYADPSDGTTASTIYTDYVELEIELNQNAQLWNPRFPLYEVDATTEYPNILTTWDENEVMRRYPMVESVQHVQNPYVMAEGENLLPPFTEWISGNADLDIKSPYEAILKSTSTSNLYCYIDIPVKGGQTYTFSVNKSGNGVFKVQEYKNGVYNNVAKITTSATWTLLIDTTHLRVELNNNLMTGDTTFTNPMLTLGSTAKPFVERNPSYLYAETKLGAIGDKKDILFKDGQDWKVTKWVEKDVVLDGKLSWSFMGDYTGYKRFNGGGLSNTLSTPNDKFVLTKFDGKKLKFRPDSNWQTDESYCFNNTVSISISDTYTGFGEHYKPSQQEIQAYFNGWKANGYTTGTSVTNELTGQLAPSGTYTFAQSGAYRNVVVEKSTDNSTWSTATENIDFKIDISGTKAVLTNLSLSPLYFRISYNYGVTVNSWASLVDGSAPVTNTLAYVSANMAPGFTPYKLSYVLATPQTIVVSDKVEGDIVVNGATQVEVGSGVIVMEKANPQFRATDSTYYLNAANLSGLTSSQYLKYRVNQILSVYKNGVVDKKWRIYINSNYSNGMSNAQIAQTDFDPTADYYVTYIVYDRNKFTTNILSVTATYANNIRSALDDVTTRVSDIATEVSVNINAIVDLYARVKALEGGA